MIFLEIIDMVIPRSSSVIGFFYKILSSSSELGFVPG